MWFNKITGKVYIGSASDGFIRLNNYYQPSTLNRNDTVSRIYKGILKYGHSSFKLIILEVCGDTYSVSKQHLLGRENYYLNWVLNTYGKAFVMNIQFEAHSFLGYKHTDELKAKFSAARMGSNNPMFGKPKSAAFLAHQRKPSEIYIYDLNMNLVSRIFGLKAVSKELHISDKTVSKYKDTNKPFKGYYFFSKLQ